MTQDEHARVPMAPALAAAAVLLLAAALFTAILRFPDPPGVDGYFYLRQIESLASGAGFYFKDWSPVFLPPALLTALGVPALDALRASVAVTWALLVVLGGALGARLVAVHEARPRHAWAVAGASTAALASSAPLRELVFEYEKTAASIALLLGAALLVVGARGRRARLAFAVALAALALVTHKLAVVFVCAFALAWLLRRLTVRRAAAVAGANALMLGLFFLVFDRAGPFFLAWSRFTTTPARFLAFYAHVAGESFALVAAFIVSLVGVAAYAGGRSRAGDAGARAVYDAGVVLAAVALCPWLLAGPAGFTWRIVLAAPLIWVPFVAAVATRGPCAFAAAAAALVLFSAPVVLDDGLARSFPRWSRFDDDVHDIERFVSPADLLVAHHGLELYLAERTGLRARQFVDAREGQRVFRVAHLPEEHAALDDFALVKLGDEYALFVEEDWRALGVAPDPKNPSAHRPAFVSDYP